MRTVFFLFHRAFTEWTEIHASRFGAALAYYSMFTIAPALIIIVGIAGLFFGPEAARANIVGEIEGTTGRPVALAIQHMLAQNADPNRNALATLLGVAVVLVGALGVFGELQEALNAVWKVTPKPWRGLRGLLWDRVVSLSMVLGSGFLLLVSLAVHAVLAGMSGYLSRSLPGGAEFWEAINVVVSFAVTTLLFALIFRYVPDAQIAWRDVWVGALLTSVLFTAGKFLLGWYLGQASTTSAYGAAASLVVVLLWVYYASQILLFGAAFTRAYTIWTGARVVPSPHALSTAKKTGAA